MQTEGAVTSIALRGDGHEVFVGTNHSIIYRVGFSDFVAEQRMVSHYERVNVSLNSMIVYSLWLKAKYNLI